MSNLIECPSCGKQVSSEASACPGCGHPFKAVKTTSGIDLTDPVHIAGIVLCCLMILGALAAIIFSMI